MKLVARVGTVISSIVALAFDYPWGDFRGHTHWMNVGWIPFVSPPVRLSDVILNVLLFLPLGVFSGLLKSSKGPLRVVAIAAPVALLGEWTQLYSHTRFASATDLVCNVAGAIAGAALLKHAVRTGTSVGNCREARRRG